MFGYGLNAKCPPQAHVWECLLGPQLVEIVILEGCGDLASLEKVRVKMEVGGLETLWPGLNCSFWAVG